MGMTRVVRHLFTPHWVVRRAFPKSSLRTIEQAVRESEKSHAGELRIAIEGPLHVWSVAAGETPRERAVELFSQLRVWDTEHNSGVLVYLQLVDHCIEIIADRGIHAHVGEQAWSRICRRIETSFKARRYETGVLDGIREITELLNRHFPAEGRNEDELPDKPVIL
ncbi:MAG TPA: TPM domain-containing protein [Burkholderiales bacterium]|nr:TPM domain-containing protein [Burkholderiales bacterium]